jgi:hypothetical protein
MFTGTGGRAHSLTPDRFTGTAGRSPAKVVNSAGSQKEDGRACASHDAADDVALNIQRNIFKKK